MATPMLPTKGRNQRGIDRFAQLVPADLGQIGQRDADNQGRFDAFAEGDNEGFQHLRKKPLDFENEFQFQLKG